jgi:hypothetical protein
MPQTINVGGKELDDAVFQIVRRASVDPEFRALAVKDGNAALAKINPKLSAGVDLRFLDRTNQNPMRMTLTLVLPDLAEAGELSEEELRQVAGGASSVQAHGVDIQKSVAE